jgi:predicted branched-subunit amino acid permease
MMASGAPLWLVAVMSLLINARHVVYGPNLAQWLSGSRWWPWLMHGLTDQMFALAHTRFPLLPANERLGWFTGAMFLAWFGWIGGTVLGVITGAELTQRWPLLGEVMSFALPALFLVLLAPHFTSWPWAIALGSTTLVALLLKLYGLPNAAIPIAAACGALSFFVIDTSTKRGGKKNG